MVPEKLGFSTEVSWLTGDSEEKVLVAGCRVPLFVTPLTVTQLQSWSMIQARIPGWVAISFQRCYTLIDTWLSGLT